MFYCFKYFWKIWNHFTTQRIFEWSRSEQGNTGTFTRCELSGPWNQLLFRALLVTVPVYSSHWGDQGRAVSDSSVACWSHAELSLLSRSRACPLWVVHRPSARCLASANTICYFVKINNTSIWSFRACCLPDSPAPGEAACLWHSSFGAEAVTSQTLQWILHSCRSQRQSFALAGAGRCSGASWQDRNAKYSKTL